MVRKSRFSRLRPAARERDAVKVPAAAQRVAPSSPEAVAEITLRVACPECAGPVSVPETAAAAHCEFCGSLLNVSGGDDVRYYRMLNTIDAPDAIGEILIQKRLIEKKAELYARKENLGQQNELGERLAGEAMLLALIPTDRIELDLLEKRLRRSTRVNTCWMFHAPYWHFDRWLVSATMAREQRSKSKVMLLSADHWDATVAGYPAEANLRDRNLRINSAHVELLTRAQAATTGSYLRLTTSLTEATRLSPHPMPPRLDRETHEKLQAWLINMSERSRLVYKPYWYAEVECDGRAHRILVDGTYRQIAGYLDAEEATRLEKLLIDDAIYPDVAPTVRLAADECPVCGFEAPAGSADLHLPVSFCPNCHRGLERRGAELRELAYLIPPEVDEGEDYQWLPVYRIEARYSTDDGELSPGELRRRLLPPALATCEPGDWAHLFIPAFPEFRLDRPDPLIRQMLQLCRRIATRAPRLRRDRIPIQGDPRLHPSPLTPAEARALAPVLLFEMLDRVTHLSSLQATRYLDPARLQLGPPELVMLPFLATSRGMEFALGGDDAPEQSQP